MFNEMLLHKQRSSETTVGTVYIVGFTGAFTFTTELTLSTNHLQPVFKGKYFSCQDKTLFNVDAYEK